VIPKHGPNNLLYLTREDPFVRNPLAPPYVLKNITAEREIVLNANENYFKADRTSTSLSPAFADQNIMTQALMFNAIDMIVLVNPRDIPEIQGD